MYRVHKIHHCFGVTAERVSMIVIALSVPRLLTSIAVYYLIQSYITLKYSLKKNLQSDKLLLTLPRRLGLSSTVGKFISKYLEIVFCK